MTGAPQPTRRRPHAFFAGFAVAALLVAGLLSYLASPAPDGLDAVTLQGCTASEIGGAERLSGQCVARNAEDHPLANSPLADYTLGGEQALTGVSGVIGVLATLALAGGVFWLARPRRRGARAPGSTD
jgi:cobalt/nickel transport protein